MHRATTHISPPDRLPAGPLLIGGEWVDSSARDRIEIIDPANETPLTTVAAASAADVDRAVAAARAALNSDAWGGSTGADRARWLHRLADAIDAHAEELAALETLDTGKPIRDTLAVDIPCAAACYRYFAGWADKLAGEALPTAGAYRAQRLDEPAGVVGQIISFNFPALLQAWKWAPALAAGCTMVLKPAEPTPLTALRIAELATEQGLPPGVVNVVTGRGEEAGAALASHPDVDLLAFTGSTAVGRSVLQAAAQSNFKRTLLELGGKSPNLIFPDADLDRAADTAFTAAFFNQGQCCCAGSRLYLHEDVYEPVLQRLLRRASRQRCGDPFDPHTNQGPVISVQQLASILGYVEAGRSAGAVVRAGGGRVDRPGYYIEPTVMVDVEDDAVIAREEIFGPVLCVFRFRDVEEAIERANASDFGLAAGVWTRSLNLANRLAGRLRAGTVWINCYHVFDPAIPFGGDRHSGGGRELGERGVRAYTRSKSVVQHASRG